MQTSAAAERGLPRRRISGSVQPAATTTKHAGVIRTASRSGCSRSWDRAGCCASSRPTSVTLPTGSSTSSRSSRSWRGRPSADSPNSSRAPLDGVRGKRFWSTDEFDATEQATATMPAPAAGVVGAVSGVERLTFFVHSEPFDNGAIVSVRVRFRADRPHEVALAAFARTGSAPLAVCVLTATMGNFARLRRLHLRDRVVTPAQLWPGFGGDHFAEHARFGLDELTRTADGGVEVIATPDEPRPHEARVRRRHGRALEVLRLARRAGLAGRAAGSCARGARQRPGGLLGEFIADSGWRIVRELRGGAALRRRPGGHVLDRAVRVTMNR